MIKSETSDTRILAPGCLLHQSINRGRISDHQLLCVAMGFVRSYPIVYVVKVSANFLSVQLDVERLL